MGINIIPKPPKPPLSRVIKEGCGVFCDICKSTMSRSGVLGIIGKRYCDNSKCINTNPNK